MKYISKVAYALLIVLLNACNTSSAPEIYPITGDSVVVDIPMAKDNEFFDSYLVTEQVVRKLGMYDLKQGMNSNEIRIWYGYAQSSQSKLILLKSSSDKWEGKFFTIELIGKMGKVDSVITKAVVEKAPRSGWDKLIDHLYKLKIKELPDHTQISGYPVIADGDNVIFEIRIGNRYRFYAYPEPEISKDRIWQSKNVVQILRLLEDELDISLTRTEQTAKSN